MKNRSQSHRLLILLATTVSGAALLSACSTTNELLNKWTGNARPKQTVVSGRHAPEMNPQGAPAEAEATHAPAGDTPFDHYDVNGNPVEPKAAAPAAKNSSGESNMFTRWMSPPAVTAPPAAAPVAADVAPSTDGVRKPLLENPYTAKEMSPPPVFTPPQPALKDITPVSSAASPAAPVSEAAPVKDTAPVAEAAAPMVAPQLQTNITPTETNAPATAEPVVTEETAESSESKPSFFSRLFSGFHKKPAEDTVGKSDAASEETASQDFTAQPDKKLSTPALASVPPTPTEFKSIKADRQQNMEELTSDHMAADQEKQSLDAEPSQQQVTPTLPLAENKPAAPGEPGGEVLLGHASAPVQTDKAAAPAEQAETLAPAAEKPAAAPVTQAAAQPQDQPEQEVRHRKSWLERLSPFASDEEDEDMDNDQAAAADAEQQAEEQAAPSQPVAATEEAPPATQAPAPVVQMPETPAVQPAVAASAPVAPSEPVAAPVPLLPQTAQAPAPEALPTLVPAAAPVAEVSAAEPQTATQNAAGSAALPSPEILQTVKILPPSRYLARQRALQHSPDSY